LRSFGTRSICENGAAKESNLPTRGLHGPAGFEVRGFAGISAAPGWDEVLSVRCAQLRIAEFGTVRDRGLLPNPQLVDGWLAVRVQREVTRTAR
jgi:hypothetical protein